MKTLLREPDHIGLIGDLVTGRRLAKSRYLNDFVSLELGYNLPAARGVRRECVMGVFPLFVRLHRHVEKLCAVVVKGDLHPLHQGAFVVFDDPFATVVISLRKDGNREGHEKENSEECGAG